VSAADHRDDVPALPPLPRPGGGQLSQADEALRRASPGDPAVAVVTMSTASDQGAAARALAEQVRQRQAAIAEAQRKIDEARRQQGGQ
jgi:hypothetical protein